MNLINKCMEELLYKKGDDFSFSIENDKKSWIVYPYISKEPTVDVCLFAPLNVEDLAFITEDVFMEELYDSFLSQSFYKAAYEKNTSLVYVVEYENGCLIPDEIQIRIEDDPYYFKKYVLSYSASEKKEAVEYLDALKDKNLLESSIITIIQQYISNIDNFAIYKEDITRDSVYTYFLKLSTKIPCFPIDVFNKEEFEDMEKLMSQNSLDYDVNQVEKFISSIQLKSCSPENIIKYWNECKYLNRL